MPSQRLPEGFLLIDNRESGGATQAVVDAARRAGHDVINPRDRLFESATQTCAHCNRVVVLNPSRTRPRKYCAKCDAYVCDGACALFCSPFRAMLDAEAARLARVEAGKGLI